MAPQQQPPPTPSPAGPPEQAAGSEREAGDTPSPPEAVPLGKCVLSVFSLEVSACSGLSKPADGGCHHEFVRAPCGANSLGELGHDGSEPNSSAVDMGGSPCSKLGESPCPRTHNGFISGVGRSPRPEATGHRNSRVGMRLGRERLAWANVGVGCSGLSCSSDVIRRNRARECCTTIESSFVLSTRGFRPRVEGGAAVITGPWQPIYIDGYFYRGHSWLKFRYWKIAQARNSTAPYPSTTTLPNVM